MNIANILKLAIFKLCYPNDIELIGNRSKVISGPFAGMKYLPQINGNFFAAKILGTYEMELYDVVNEILETNFTRIINIGAAEGYYAVGISLTHKFNPEVIAFEADASAQALVSQLAAINQTRPFEIKGKCEPRNLTAALVGEGQTLVICDTEGYERDLLDPELIGGLRTASVLVELHDFVYPGIRDLIAERFKRSHLITTISSKPRTVADMPYTTFRAKLIPPALMLRAMDEHRPGPMEWLWMKPVNRVATNGASSTPL